MIDVVTLYFWDPKTYQVLAPMSFQGNIKYLGIHQHEYNYKPHKTYYPHVEIRKYIAPYPKSVTTSLVVKVSLPKLVYGNNLMELVDGDFQTCCTKLSDILYQMGILITPQQIAQYGDVRGFEYGKNLLTDRIPVSFILSEISRAQPIHHCMDIQRVAYQNGGEKLVLYSKGYELVFYDKTKELQKELKQPYCYLPVPLKAAVQKNQINVLRMELRFHNRKSWQKMLYPYCSQIRFATFQDIFSSRLARAILLHYWHQVSDSVRKTPMESFDPAFELWRMSQGVGKKLKPQALMARLGTNYLMRGAGYHKAKETLKRLGFSNPSMFLRANTGSVSRVNWRMDIWRFLDHSLSRFKCLTPNKWIRLKQRSSSVWFKRYEPLLTVEEVARQLNVSVQVIRQEIRRNLLPAYKIGKSLRISRAALASYLNRCIK